MAFEPRPEIGFAPKPATPKNRGDHSRQGPRDAPPEQQARSYKDKRPGDREEGGSTEQICSARLLDRRDQRCEGVASRVRQQNAQRNA